MAANDIQTSRNQRLTGYTISGATAGTAVAINRSHASGTTGGGRIASMGVTNLATADRTLHLLLDSSTDALVSVTIPAYAGRQNGSSEDVGQHDLLNDPGMAALTEVDSSGNRVLNVGTTQVLKAYGSAANDLIVYTGDAEYNPVT